LPFFLLGVDVTGDSTASSLTTELSNFPLTSTIDLVFLLAELPSILPFENDKIRFFFLPLLDLPGSLFLIFPEVLVLVDCKGRFMILPLRPSSELTNSIESKKPEQNSRPLLAALSGRNMSGKSDIRAIIVFDRLATGFN